MGHRCFGKTASKSGASCSKQKFYNNSVIAKDDKMNGIRKVTQEQAVTAAELRRKLRDQISSKMGDMLLHGYTMLNAYCDICSGILMEDRQGVRICVTCDLTTAELNPTASAGSRLVAEIPLDASDEIYDNAASMSAAIRQQLVESSEDVALASESIATLKQSKEDALKEVYKIGLAKCEQKKAAGDTGGTETMVIDTPKSKRQSAKRAMMRRVRRSGIESALTAVDEKLKWCSERLMNTENLEEIVLLHKAIRSGIDILESCSSHK